MRENEMILTERAKERVILIGIDTGSQTFSAEESLEELADLAETAGAHTVGMLIQPRTMPHRATFLGKGKLEELKILIDDTEADAIIADEELSPAQMRNLAEHLSIKIMDRTVLILDIFAMRAQSSEGKIQVELAQQKYRLSHLTGIGKSLSRLGGGIGTRGPGEKKLETDRRHIRTAIANLESELKQIASHRQLLQKNQKGVPVISIVGYTNAGKSTLLNYLTNAGVLAEDKLFATLDTTARNLKLPGGSEIRLTDTVGFIHKLPHGIVSAFRATLEELKHADILVHVVDISNPQYEMHIKVVYQVLEEMACSDKPIILVFNKYDAVASPHLPSDARATRTNCISAKTGEGVDELLLSIQQVLKEMRKPIKVLLPYTQGGLLNTIHLKSEICKETHQEDGIAIECFTDSETAKRLEPFIIP